MKAKEIRRRASSDLVEEVKRLQKEVFDRRFHGESEEKTDRGVVHRARRDVARIKTILRQRELGKSAEPASGKKE
jgi:large subunit ribosomal protein L29